MPKKIVHNNFRLDIKRFDKWFETSMVFETEQEAHECELLLMSSDDPPQDTWVIGQVDKPATNRMVNGFLTVIGYFTHNKPRTNEEMEDVYGWPRVREKYVPQVADKLSEWDEFQKQIGDI